jgi:hypothetical protein
MSKTEKPIQDYFEEMASTGNGSYAIAYAIMLLAEEQRSVAGALNRMGLNSQNPAAASGALGDLAKKFK